MSLILSLLALWVIGAFIVSSVLLEMGTDPKLAKSWAVIVFWPFISLCLLSVVCICLLVICKAKADLLRFS
jgi:hypothetical protein